MLSREVAKRNERERNKERESEFEESAHDEDDEDDGPCYYCLLQSGSGLSSCKLAMLAKMLYRLGGDGPPML